MTAADPRWAAAPERGSAFMVGLGLRLVLGLGWHFGRVLLLGITAWFLATSPGARAASRDYLDRVLGRPARAWDVARHIHAFAASILDAPFLRAGRTDRFHIEVTGLEHFDRALAEGRGCVLLGSHLGSFEVLRHFGHRSPVPVRPLMFRANAGVLSRLLDRLDPGLRDSIIEIGRPESLLAAREALARGEVLGVLADRDPTGGRATVVPFLGSPAAFPDGPMRLVGSLAAPVVLFRAVCTGPRRYLVCFLPFGDPAANATVQPTVRLAVKTTVPWTDKPTPDQAPALPTPPAAPHAASSVTSRGVAQGSGRGRVAERGAALARYVAFVEAGCRAYPYQWFNFFPFWSTAANAADAPPASPAVRNGVLGAPGGHRAA